MSSFSNAVRDVLNVTGAAPADLSSINAAIAALESSVSANTETDNSRYDNIQESLADIRSNLSAPSTELQSQIDNLLELINANSELIADNSDLDEETKANLQEQINALQTSHNVAELQAAIANLQNQLAEVSASLPPDLSDALNQALTTATSANEAVSSAMESIETLTASISANSAAISNNTEAINANATALATALSATTANATAINELQGQVETNITATAANTTALESLTSTVAANTAAIGVNTAAIATTQAAVTGNSKAITTMQDAIDAWEDKDTVYDDTSLVQRIEALEANPATSDVSILKETTRGLGFAEGETTITIKKSNVTIVKTAESPADSTITDGEPVVLRYKTNKTRKGVSINGVGLITSDYTDIVYEYAIQYAAMATVRSSLAYQHTPTKRMFDGLNLQNSVSLEDIGIHAKGFAIKLTEANELKNVPTNIQKVPQFRVKINTDANDVYDVSKFTVVIYEDMSVAVGYDPENYKLNENNSTRNENLLSSSYVNEGDYVWAIGVALNANISPPIIGNPWYLQAEHNLYLATHSLTKLPITSSSPAKAEYVCVFDLPNDKKLTVTITNPEYYLESLAPNQYAKLVDGDGYISTGLNMDGTCTLEAEGCLESTSNQGVLIGASKSMSERTIMKFLGVSNKIQYQWATNTEILDLQNIELAKPFHISVSATHYDIRQYNTDGTAYRQVSAYNIKNGYTGSDDKISIALYNDSPNGLFNHMLLRKARIISKEGEVNTYEVMKQKSYENPYYNHYVMVRTFPNGLKQILNPEYKYEIFEIEERTTDF